MNALGIKKTMTDSSLPKKNILCFVQLPPPIHGASLINSQVVSSDYLKQQVNLSIIELQLSKNLSNLGKFSVYKIFKFLSTCCLLIHALLKKRIDLVYMSINPTGAAFYRDLIYVTILKFFRKKIVYHLHGKGIFENSQHWLKKLTYQFVFQNTNIITPSLILSKSEFSRLKLKNTFIHVVENGIPTLTIPIPEKNSSILKCLFLATLMESKGVYNLIDAFEIIQEYYPSVQLDLVGAPINQIEEEKIKNYITYKNLWDKISILPPDYSNNKYHHFSNADIFIYPTLNDCFPLVLLEAMQTGIAIITTDVGGISDIIQNNKSGIIVNKQDIKAIADKTLQLLQNNEKRKNLGVEARKQFLSKFTLDTFERKMWLVFEKIIE